MTDYHIEFFFSEEDGCCVADLPDFEFCSAFGATAEGGLAELGIAREAWLKAAAGKGDPITGPRHRPLLYLLG